jgi:hypothetical protein
MFPFVAFPEDRSIVHLASHCETRASYTFTLRPSLLPIFYSSSFLPPLPQSAVVGSCSLCNAGCCPLLLKPTLPPVQQFSYILKQSKHLFTITHLRDGLIYFYFPSKHVFGVSSE